jgi:transcriptional regulator with XRE-family HTH domain
MPIRNKSGDPAIAARVKELRSKEGLSQEDLAEKLDVSFSLISKIETAQIGLGKKTLRELANLFNVSQSFILFGNSEQAQSILLPPGLTNDDVEAIQRMALHIAKVRQAKTRQQLRTKAYADMDHLSPGDSKKEPA